MTFDEVMEHHGVKGMHWGQKKAPTLTPADQKKDEIAKINRKLDNIDANRVLNGLSSSGRIQKRMANKEIKKDPNFRFSKLSEEQKKAFRDKAANKAIRGLAARGALEAGVVLGGGVLLVSSIASGKAAQQGKVAFAGLSVKVLQMQLSQIRDVQISKKFNNLHARRDILEKKK
jgi:hypothetical protein